VKKRIFYYSILDGILLEYLLNCRSWIDSAEEFWLTEMYVALCPTGDEADKWKWCVTSRLRTVFLGGRVIKG